jgi:hypothetical protein
VLNSSSALQHNTATDAVKRPRGQVVAGCILLIFLTALEIASFAIGAPFSVVAAYIWFALGVVSFTYLCFNYISAVITDLRHGSIWGLLPLIAAAPICFFYIDSFAFLNTESLSELHDTYAQLQKPDRAYTSVFWASYPSRSLVLNLIPTAIFGISPWSYRVGFSYPIFFGVLFLFAGIRRYHIQQRWASAVAGIAAASIFTYPMFCQISRSFEMAISSVSFGMWAIGAVLLFAAGPTALSAIVAAWTIGLLSASFTSGLALVALLWLLLGIWGARAYLSREWSIAALVSCVLLNCVVVGTALYLIRPRTLRAKQIPFSDMLSNFSDALGYTLSFSQPVFTATALVVPTLLAILFSLSLRGGWLPLILTGWCFPVIWSATNMHGKIGPQLPFALYRSLIIIPIVVYVIACMLFWVLARLERYPWTIRGVLILLAISLYPPISQNYRTHQVLMKPRPAEGRELITQEILKVIDQAGLSPQSSAWIANRTDEKKIENFLPCFQYFLLGWTRIDRSRPLPLETADAARTPGVIVTMQDDPITSQTFPGYKLELIPLPNATHKPEQGALVALLARPE